MDTPAFSLPSFAKINLSLRILGKRSDGFHEVRTVLQSISLHDELTFRGRAGGEFSLTCDDSEIPTDQTNLIFRAYLALKRAIGVEAGASVHLTKRIPTKAGLGGGSSNAAVALLGLVRLWQVDVDETELREIGASLGADVPFFLVGGRAFGSGIGAAIIPLKDITQLNLLLISPNASVSTLDAYAALSAPALTSSEAETILAVSQREAISCDSHLWDLSDKLVNDFEPVIFDREPEIERAKNALLRAGAQGALLAGSGASVFGIFGDVEAQLSAAELIQAEEGWRLFPCVTISGAEYTRAFRDAGSLGSF